MRDDRSREPLNIGSDYSRHPMPGQLSLDTRAAGEVNKRVMPTAVNGYSYKSYPDHNAEHAWSAR